jgi:hypothetical protein
MSAYVPTDWVDGATPLNAANFDKIEAELVLLDARKVPDPTGLDEKWLKAEGGAMVWVDAPTGGGGSSIEYENAWAAGTPYLAGDVVIHNGVEYLAVNPSTGDEPAPAAAASPVGVIPLVTALPATPFDGQECILVDSLTAPTRHERRRYNATSGKWAFLGGTMELAYAEYTGADISAPTGGVDVVTLPALTFDGATTIMLEANIPTAAKGGNIGVNIRFFDGAADVPPGLALAGSYGPDLYLPLMGRKRITPSAGSHTYKLRAFGLSGTATIYRATGDSSPIFIRAVRV